MPTSFVTGANRGIGLEYVRQLAGRGHTVYAGARRPGEAKELNAIAGDVRVVQCDVVDPASVAAAAKGVQGKIDLLINNAGVSGAKYAVPSDAPLDLTAATDVLRINVLGPMLVIQLLAEKMARPSKAVTISSGYGSITQADATWPAVYCASKAAANMAAKIVADQLKDRGVTYVSLSPGWVKTDMGGMNATQTPEESITKMLKVIDGLNEDDAGKFFDQNGKVMPF